MSNEVMKTSPMGYKKMQTIVTLRRKIFTPRKSQKIYRINRHGEFSLSLKILEILSPNEPNICSVEVEPEDFLFC